MIFNSEIIIDNTDMIQESSIKFIKDTEIIQEAFKSVKDAEKAYKQMKDKEKGFMPWFKLVCKFFLVGTAATAVGVATAGLVVGGGIGIGIGYVSGMVLNAFTNWLALPGTLGSKINKCNKFINECDKTMEQLTDEKQIKEFKKLKDTAIREKEKYEKRERQLGGGNKTLGRMVANSLREGVDVIDNYCTTACMYETYYEDYISTMIANEEALTKELQSLLPINESNYNDIVAINESRFRDVIKANCNRFMEFVNNLAGKFLESMTKILLNENKKYLEKYKDIILNKQPKDLEATFTGDYYLSTTRCQNMMIPIFNYNDYGSLLLQNDGMEALITKLMTGKTGFSYNKDKDMAESFKSYFIAGEKGEHKKKFKELDFKEMYNFCYNFKEIINIVNKDKKYLKQSTDAVVKAITDELNKLDQENKDNNPNKDTTTRTDTKTVNNTNTDNKKDNESAKTPEELQNKSGTENANASFIFPKSYMKYIREADNKDDHDPTKTNLSIDGVSSYGSYDDPDTSSASSSAKNLKSAGKSEADLNKIAMKWMEICRKLLGAKFNALEQIAKNYMAIIRAHVRSYVGNEDDKTTDRKDNKEDQENNNDESDNK